MGRQTIAALLRPLRGLRARFARDKSGITSVEFAMIATPFIGITFAMIETSLLLLNGQALDTSVQDATRQLMTGEFQNKGYSDAEKKEKFKAEICKRMTILPNCTNKVYIDARSYTAAAPAPQMPIAAGNFDPGNFIFKPGGPNCILVFRAAIEYPVYVTLLGNGLQTLTNGKRVVLTTVSFRNEPYATPTPPPCQSS